MQSHDLRLFLERIWGSDPCVVRLATRTKELRFRSTLYKWPQAEEDVLQFIEGNDAAGNEVYYSPDLFKLEALEVKRASKDMVLGSRVICLDFDGNAPDSSVWDDSGMYEGMPEPSFIVQSSKVDNQHIYWLLDELITDIDLLENMRRAITYKLKADGSGWDAGQLLRPPNTTNYGYVKKREETYDVFIERTADRSYDPSLFTPPKDFRPLVSASIDTDSLPSVVSVLAKGDFVHGFIELFDKSLDEIVAQGDRSNPLCRVGYDAAESGLSDQEIYVLVQDADTRWGKYVGRTDRHKQLCGIVDRARVKHPYGASEIGFVGFDGDGKADISTKLFFEWSELHDSDLSMEWLIEDLLPVGGYLLIGGPPGIGKTQIGIRLGESVALGKNFLGWKIAHPGEFTNVLFFSLEMNALGIKYFINQMTDLIPVADQLSQHFNFYMGQPLYLDDVKSQQVFRSYMEMYKPGLIIIDSLSQVIRGSLAVDEPIRHFNTFISDVRERYGCAVALIHHSKKKQAESSKMPVDLDRLFGSLYIGQRIDAGILLDKTPNMPNVMDVTSIKMRYSATRDPFKIKRDSMLNFNTFEPSDDDVMNMMEGMLGVADSGGPTPRRGDPPSQGDTSFF